MNSGLRQAPGCSRAHGRLCCLGDRAAQDVFAGGVDPIDDQHEQRNQQQVAVAEHQPEGARPARRAHARKRDRELLRVLDGLDLVLAGGRRELGRGQVGRKMGLVLGSLASIHHVADRPLPGPGVRPRRAAAAVSPTAE